MSTWHKGAMPFLPSSSTMSTNSWVIGSGGGGGGGASSTMTVYNTTGGTGGSYMNINPSNIIVTQFCRELSIVEGEVYSLPNGKCLEIKDGHLLIGELYDKATFVKIEDLDEIKELISLKYGEIVIKRGEISSVVMPDGSIIEISRDGNYVINDKNSKPTYRANRLGREFNKFMNASDLLEQFIDYVKVLDVSQTEFLKLPVELFINWLIMQAAIQDGEEPPVVPMLPAPNTCLHCKETIPANSKLQFCSKEHMNLYWDENS